MRKGRTWLPGRRGSGRGYGAKTVTRLLFLIQVEILMRCLFMCGSGCGFEAVCGSGCGFVTINLCFYLCI